MATNPLTPRVNNIETGGTWKIGDVKQSFLTEAEFQAEHDDTWVLCDGRDVIGSDYAILKEGDAITSHNIPDARGQFLRGLDTTQGVDPDFATRTLGGSQADGFQDHEHLAYRYINQTGGELAYAATNDDGTRITLATAGVQPGSAGTPRNIQETRPKNVACNMFIKINREPSS